MDLTILVKAAVLIASFIIIMPVMVSLHELGHLVGGKIDGLEFISFRYGNKLISRENGRLKLKTLETSQLGGQCLMAPKPGVSYTKAPVAYLAGGLVVNLVLGLAAAVILYALARSQTPFNWVIVVVLSVVALLGLGAFFKNVLPIRAGIVLSDGYLLKEIATYKGARGFEPILTQLRFARMNAEQTSFGSADPALFELPDDFDPRRPLHAQNAVLTMNYLIVQGKVKEAAEIGEKILAANPGDRTFGREVNELLYFEYLMGKLPAYRADKSVLDDLVAYALHNPGNPSLMRLAFAHYLLVVRDTPRAKLYKEQFLRACEATHFKAEIDREKKLLAAVERRAATIKAIAYPVAHDDKDSAE